MFNIGDLVIIKAWSLASPESIDGYIKSVSIGQISKIDVIYPNREHSVGLTIKSGFYNYRAYYRPEELELIYSV